jgi:hypothetical protein
MYIGNDFDSENKSPSSNSKIDGNNSPANSSPKTSSSSKVSNNLSDNDLVHGASRSSQNPHLSRYDKCIFVIMCIYIHIFVCLYLCIYTCICKYVFTYICIYKYIPIFKYIYIYIYMSSPRGNINKDASSFSTYSTYNNTNAIDNKTYPRLESPTSNRNNQNDKSYSSTMFMSKGR